MNAVRKSLMYVIYNATVKSAGFGGWSAPVVPQFSYLSKPLPPCLVIIIIIITDINDSGYRSASCGSDMLTLMLTIYNTLVCVIYFGSYSVDLVLMTMHISICTI